MTQLKIQNSHIWLTVSMFLVPSFVFASTSPPPNMIVGYSISSSHCTAPCVPSQFDAWFANHYQLIISGGTDNLTSYLLPTQMWPSYIDGCCIDNYQIYNSVYATAVAQGFSDPEGLLLHMTADY